MKRQLDFGGHFAYISNNDDDNKHGIWRETEATQTCWSLKHKMKGGRK